MEVAVKYRLLELLRCPYCDDTLRLFSFAEFEEEVSGADLSSNSLRCQTLCGLHQISLRNHGTEKENRRIDCAACYRREIAEGLLVCKCGSLFPIVDGVPRIVDNGIAAFPDFKQKYGERIETIVRDCRENGKAENYALPEEFESIRSSFSQEWKFFDYEHDKTWGWNVAERKKVFLEDIGAEPSWLKGKLMLDAGCGNGILTAALQDFAVEVVGLDLSDSIIQANRNKQKYTKDKHVFVHFVQGNLFNPPLAKASFDLIYSSGVLHHTPDTMATFRRLVPLLKKGGRVYIWVYGKRGWLVSAFFWHGRLLKRYVSLNALLNYCRILSPFYKIITDLLSTLKIYRFRTRTVREIALDLFDAFSPPYNHTHTRNEVCGWFAEENLANICVSGVQKHGFGVKGDKL
jgi:ubiquinone/menaquinone biosynthesis C-methylase UbiE/uncharacterized protein YbaR (Trm112 family)